MKTNSFACLAFLSTWPASSIGQLRAIRGTSRKDLFPSPRTLQNSDTPFLPDSVHYATGVVGGSAFGSKTTGDGLYTYSSVNAKVEDDGVATNAPVSAASSKFPNNGIVNMDEVDGGSGFGSTTTGGGLYTYSTVNAVESPDFIPFGTSTDIVSGGAAGVNPPVSSRIIPAPTLRPVRSSTPTRRPTKRPVLRPASTSRPTKKAALTKIPTRPPIPAPVNDNLAGLAASWVVAHNIRREYLHRAGSKSFVPLTWSNTLAVSAQAYAEELLSYSPQCAIVHGYNGNSFGGGTFVAISEACCTDSADLDHHSFIHFCRKRCGQLGVR